MENTKQKTKKTASANGTSNQKSQKNFKKSTNINFSTKQSLGLRKKEKTSIKVGRNYNVKITALSSANLGLNEFTYGFPILIGGLKQANATLGDSVQVQILKIQKSKTKAQKYAIAKVVKVVTKATQNTFENSSMLGQTLDVTILKNGPKGTYLAELPGNFKLVINAQETLTLGQKVTVKVTRVKQKYGFAKLVTTTQTAKAFTSVKEGAKVTLVLPKKAKRYCKHIVVQINLAAQNISKLFGPVAALKKLPTILFIKPIAGSKLGNKVQIQIIKGFQSKNSNILIGQIVEINPMSSTNKKALVKTNIKQMLNSGMHYGEKAIKCNARMKNYVWNRKKGANQNKPLIQKGRNIINLFKTRSCLNKALAQLTKYAAKGKTFLFVGTKKAAAGLIARASLFSKNAFFVNTRWLGGMLTNWKTIFQSISKIRPILKEKQVIIKDILQKRQNIQTLLIEKAFLLKKKSKIVLAKGRQLLQKFNKSQNNTTLLEKAQKLTLKRKELVQKGQVLLEKRQLLLQKRKQLITQSQALYQKAITLVNNSKEFFTKATLLRQKLRELKALLLFSQQIQKLQQNAKQQNKALYTVTYNQYKQMDKTLASVLPNPPQEILNKMVLFITQKTGQTANISQKDAAAKNKTFFLTELLSQFSTFAPAIKLSIKVVLADLKQVQAKCARFQETLKVILTKMQNFVDIKANILLQLRQIQQSLISQRNIIRVVKRKLKQIAAQKRFIQFLPKLRYLPTPSTKIAQTVQVLMKKVVDPKLKYPIDSIYDQKLSTQSKKVAAMRKKKWQRLEKYLGGISNMTKINPTSQQIRNNVAIIIGQQEEMNAVRECQKLGIKMFHIVDTNCNPGLADHFIPANDDSRNAIQYILTQFLTRIRLAQKLKKNLA